MSSEKASFFRRASPAIFAAHPSPALPSTPRSPRLHRLHRPVEFCRELLLVNRFQLLIDHFTGKAIDRYMQPVTLLSFNHEVSQTIGGGRVTP